jgi:RsiW-degrading membrane proteinase PrsW (M82 family)
VTIFAYLVLAAAAASYLWNLKVSYDTEGGSIGMVPVLASPIFHQAPLVTGGLFLLQRDQQWSIPWWGFVVCFLVTAILGLASTIWIGDVSKRKRGGRQ